MKKLIFILPFLTVLGNAQAQWSAGPDMSVGIGWIGSRNMHDNLNAQVSTNNEIREWKESVTPGANFGIGLAAAYNFTDNVAFMTGLRWSSFNSRFNLEYTRNRVDGFGNGDIIHESSVADIRFDYFSLPLLLKFSSSGTSKFYGLAGVKLNFLGTPVIESNETRTRTDYTNFGITSISSSNSRIVADLNVFEKTRTALELGVGYSFEAAGKMMMLDLRYDLPITKSEMYTTNQVYIDNAYNNNAVFGYDGKVEYENNAPAYPLNDFRMSTLTLTLTFMIF